MYFLDLNAIHLIFPDSNSQGASIKKETVAALCLKNGPAGTRKKYMVKVKQRGHLTQLFEKKQ